MPSQGLLRYSDLEFICVSCSFFFAAKASNQKTTKINLHISIYTWSLASANERASLTLASDSKQEDYPIVLYPQKYPMLVQPIHLKPAAPHTLYKAML